MNGVGNLLQRDGLHMLFLYKKDGAFGSLTVHIGLGLLGRHAETVDPKQNQQLVPELAEQAFRLKLIAEIAADTAGDARLDQTKNGQNLGVVLL